MFPPAPQPEPSPAEAPVNVLLVDDQPANLVALEATLGDMGLNLAKASSGEEALRRLLQEDYALVLLDLQMPGMDGFETARLIRGREKSLYTPIMFLTAHDPGAFPVAEAYSLGAVDYLVKPLVPVILRAKVSGFVELFRKTEQVRRQGERLREMERQEFDRRMAEERLRQTEERYRQTRRHNEELEQRVRERTAELTRSNRDLEQFAYVASHDLKEPLRKVRVYLQLLERRYGDRLDEQARQFIAFAVDAGARMQTLVNDLLAYARVGSRGQPPQPVSCAAACDQAVADLEAAVKESGGTVTRGDLPVVLGDLAQLVQVFRNLIDNALKFRGDGPPVVRVEAQREGGQWRVTVRDNGIGIDPRFADRLFVLFERLHGREAYPGTGIGLAICKKIVERHGGRIGVDSTPGQGATFWFTLPPSEGGPS
jgi:signal transduction histidine kinase